MRKTLRSIEDLKPDISSRGQRFYDKPVYQMVSTVNPMARSVAEAFGRRLEDIFGITHYERTPLKWVHPLSKQERIDLSLGAHPGE